MVDMHHQDPEHKSGQAAELCTKCPLLTLIDPNGENSILTIEIQAIEGGQKDVLPCANIKKYLHDFQL